MGSASARQAVLVRFEDHDADHVQLWLAPWTEDATASPDVLWVIRRGAALRNRLRQRGLNYVDLSGAVRLVSGRILIDRTDLKPARISGSARVVDPFSDRNSLVPRMLLSEPGREWRVREIAAAAGVALGTASEVLRRLGTLGLVEVSRRTRTTSARVIDPQLLVRKWCERYAWTHNRSLAFHAPIGSSSRFLARLPKALAGERWALTLQAGASLIAPHATWERVHLYAAAASVDALYEIGARAGWSPAEDGKLVLMLPYYKQSVWQGLRQVNGLPVVSTLQLVLDLWHYPLRGREQAEHLLTVTGLAG